MGSKELEDAVRCEVKDITKDKIGQKVVFNGWIYKTQQLATKTFFVVYSGGHFAKCLSSQSESLDITKYTSVEVTGEVKANFTKKDSFPCEIHAEKISVYGKKAPSLGIDIENTSESHLLDNAHILIREPERAAVLAARAQLLRVVRNYYHGKEYVEITPPTLVQTQVEGGSTLFPLDYFGEKAFLTQSSQLYLETVVPLFNRAYCIASSYRAEKSNTRRHLSEYTHVEAEIAWTDFEGLLSEIEDITVAIVEGFNSTCVPILKQYGVRADEALVPKKPFKRVTHREAIDFLRKECVKQEDGSEFTYSDDIPDASERYLCDKIGQGQPIFLIRFPAEMKSFYMERYGDGLTNSCDLLYPGVGEVVGGSMRIQSAEELLEGFRREGIESGPYKFYTDQYVFGPSPHGGYGLGFERILMALMPVLVPKVRFACLYPRFNGRCTP